MDSALDDLSFKVPPTGHMETELQFIVSSDRLEKPKMEVANPG